MGIKCPKCQFENPDDTTFCGKCATPLKLSEEEQISQTETRTLTPSQIRREIRQRADSTILDAGQKFGDYKILRLLGKGGMGEVYEADHLESGRRVALKVLSQSLSSEEDRKRFLREGRLAAQVSHPNSVYIYGTDEIDGTPVISMEYLPGGTLKDRIVEHGFMPIPEAIDAILQVIDGLEAMEAKGILHRDIKPSNCFIDNEGRVKIGDFGLSISTLARTETQLTTSATIIGTPTFAAPEQLQGKELDVRTDIYSVGATLYFLLTGNVPFEESNVVRLLSKILKDPPTSLKKINEKIPKKLEQIVQRCLNKNPKDRFNTYTELREALIPFSSATPKMPGLGIRYMATVLDFTFIILLINLIILVPTIIQTRFENVDMPVRFGYFVILPSIPLWKDILIATFVILYFALTEWILGASLGKKLFRLRVVKSNYSPPGFFKVLLRSFVFLFIGQLSIILMEYLVLTKIPWKPLGVSRIFYIEMAISDLIEFAQVNPWIYPALFLFVSPSVLFLLARRRNGFAGLHELVSSTRVVLKSPKEIKQIFEKGIEYSIHDVTGKIGPYNIVYKYYENNGKSLYLGYDPEIQRKVWIEVVSVGSPYIAQNRRDLSRPGRIRWLNCKRTSKEAWDAYEALEGRPFLTYLDTKQPWRTVRHWLMDIAKELIDATNDDSFPSILNLNMIWITEEGRAKILDFPAYSSEYNGYQLNIKNVKGKDFSSVQEFLCLVAFFALEGPLSTIKPEGQFPKVPLPIAVRNFLKDLSKKAFQDTQLLLKLLGDFAEKDLDILRKKRLIPGIIGTFLFFIISFYSYFLILQDEQWFGTMEINIQVLAGALTMIVSVSLFLSLFFKGGIIFLLLGIDIVGPNGIPASRIRCFSRSLIAWFPGFMLLALFYFSESHISAQLPILIQIIIFGLFSLGLPLYVIETIWTIRSPERALQEKISGTYLVLR